MRRSLLLVVLLAAAGCEERAEEVAREQGELADKLDDVGAEARASSRKLEEQAARIAQLEAALADLERKLEQGRPAVAPPPPPSRAGRARPDPSTVFSVPVDGSPSEGPDDALVTIVEGYEYACPYCEKARATLDELIGDYGDDLRIVRKHYIVHPTTATDPALAACAAHLQGKFAAMDELLWDKAFATRQFDEAHLETLAAEARLDLGRWRADLRGRCVDDIAADQRALAAVGQTGTPTFYVNGRYLSGAQPAASFREVIDEELERARERVLLGTRRADYYRTFVVDAGLPRFDPPPAFGP